jgi:hypothetical protein
MTRIKNYSNRLEAELARNLLITNNIDALVEADDAGGVRPFMLMGTGGAWLLVKEEHKNDALDLLSTLEG